MRWKNFSYFRFKISLCPKNFHFFLIHVYFCLNINNFMQILSSWFWTIFVRGDRFLCLKFFKIMLFSIPQVIQLALISRKSASKSYLGSFTGMRWGVIGANLLLLCAIIFCNNLFDLFFYISVQIHTCNLSHPVLMHLISLLEQNLSGGIEMDSLDFANLLASCGRAKSAYEVGIFYAFLTDISDRRYTTVLYLEKRKVLREIKSKGRVERIKHLPNASDIKSTFRMLVSKGRKITAASMILMLSSGRRKADLCRVKKSCFQVTSPGVYTILVPRDKSNSHIIAFTANLRNIPSSWLPSSRESLHKWIVNLVKNGDTFPFNEELSLNTSRDIKFSLHSLRSLAAIGHKVKGVPDHKILEIIGWTDGKMLNRYCRVCLPGTFPISLCEAVEKLTFFWI